MFRLNPLTFLVCGLVLCLVIWGGFWLLSISKTKEEITAWSEHVEKLKQIQSPASVKAAQQRVEIALNEVAKANADWDKTAKTRTPAEGRISLTDNRWQLTVKVRAWHATVERDIKNWITRGGVTLVGPGPLIPFPTDVPNDLIEYYFNYPALKFPVCFWDLGTITVQGTYEAITKHVRSWSFIPGYIASVKGLSITGTGTRLTGRYQLSILAYINTSEVFGGEGENSRVPDNSKGGGQSGNGTMDRPAPTTGGGGGGPAGGAPGSGGGRAGAE
ncbi:MAG: hypothetical protein U0R49_08290 [Fimbriimonadales bacterium]